MDPTNIVIVGGGLVGQTLAERLSMIGHDVTLIESVPDKVSGLSDTLDIRVLDGNGASSEVLRAAGAEEASLVVASTDSDEVNLVVGYLAADLFEVPRIVVRLRDRGHEEAFARICANHPGDHLAVNPVEASVDRISDLMAVPGALDVSTFFDGELVVAAFRTHESSEFAGLRVSDMSLLFATTPTLVVAVHRGTEWIVPGGAEEIRVGDLVYFAIARHEMANVLSLAGVAQELRRRAMIAGAGPIGLALARRLESRDIPVTILEEDRQRAQRAAEELDTATVIHGRVTDQSLLEDEEIENVANFVAVTDDHETNLVAGLLAKRLGAGRAFVLVDNPALVALVGDIGIDAIISPRSIIIGLTLQHVRGAGVRSGASLLEDRVEIMEVEAQREGRLCSGPLMEVKLPPGALVAALRRGDELLVPRGADRVEPGDRVLLVTTTDRASRVTAYITG